MIKQVWAQIENPAVSPDLQGPSALATYVGTVWQAAYLVGGLLLLGFLIYGAIMWLTSAGDKMLLEKAQKTITNAVIGLLILAASLPIIKIIEHVLGISILELKWPTPQ